MHELVTKLQITDQKTFAPQCLSAKMFGMHVHMHPKQWTTGSRASHTNTKNTIRQPKTMQTAKEVLEGIMEHGSVGTICMPPTRRKTDLTNACSYSQCDVHTHSATHAKSCRTNNTGKAPLAQFHRAAVHQRSLRAGGIVAIGAPVAVARVADVRVCRMSRIATTVWLLPRELYRLYSGTTPL